jgi:hypothetical protein
VSITAPFYVSPRQLKKWLAGDDPDDAGMVVHWYLAQAFLRDDDEPLDDIARLEVIMARALCGKRGGELQMPESRNSAERLAAWIEAGAAYLQALNPISTTAFWQRVLAGIFEVRYKGSKIRPKKRKALASRLDAHRLTYEQMKARYPHLSRRSIYNRLEEARRKR